MPATNEPSNPQESGRYEPTGAGCLLALASLLVIMSAEVLVVEILVAQEEHVATALEFVGRHPLHGRRGGWFGGGVLVLNAIAIAAGVLCFKLGSLILWVCGISVWKATADDSRED